MAPAARLSVRTDNTCRTVADSVDCRTTDSESCDRNKGTLERPNQAEFLRLCRSLLKPLAAGKTPGDKSRAPGRRNEIDSPARGYLCPPLPTPFKPARRPRSPGSPQYWFASVLVH